MEWQRQGIGCSVGEEREGEVQVRQGEREGERGEVKKKKRERNGGKEGRVLG